MLGCFFRDEMHPSTVDLLLRNCFAEDGDLSGMLGCFFRDDMHPSTVDLLLRNCFAEDGDLSRMLGYFFWDEMHPSTVDFCRMTAEILDFYSCFDLCKGFLYWRLNLRYLVLVKANLFDKDSSVDKRCYNIAKYLGIYNELLVKVLSYRQV